MPMPTTPIFGSVGIGLLDVGANPIATNTMTIGTRVYTFVAALTGAADEILIGALPADTAANIITAVNQNTGADSVQALVGAAPTDVYFVVVDAAGNYDDVGVNIPLAQTVGGLFVFDRTNMGETANNPIAYNTICTLTPLGALATAPFEIAFSVPLDYALWFSVVDQAGAPIMKLTSATLQVDGTDPRIVHVDPTAGGAPLLATDAAVVYGVKFG